LFRYCQGVIDLDAEIPDRTFDLGMATQELDSPKITCAPIDEGSFCASQGVRPKQPWVQSNAADPFRNKARILAGRNAGFGTATTSEQELTGPFVGGPQIIIDGLAGLLAEFKSDGPPGFLLSDRRAIRCIAAGGDLLDADGNNVAATKLAVDRQIEHGEVANSALDLELRPD
jgi:hypothetical protein